MVFQGFPAFFVPSVTNLLEVVALAASIMSMIAACRHFCCTSNVNALMKPVLKTTMLRFFSMDNDVIVAVTPVHKFSSENCPKIHNLGLKITIGVTLIY